jgi:hypothetical protein
LNQRGSELKKNTNIIALLFPACFRISCEHSRHVGAPELWNWVFC